MPLGPFGEIYGTTDTLEGVSETVLKSYETKVIAPRNPKLLREEADPFKMKPSQYMFQMTLDTEKKLANTHNMNLPKKLKLLDMGETTYQKFTQLDIEESIFQPYPSEMYFMNYEPHIVHELPLLLRNNDKVPRLVSVTQVDSPYFRIVSPPNLGNKVAPGLALTFTIQFIPDEKRDYTHELVCITEREKFIVPVKCIGSRAILDFPDEVNFQTCPVKYPSQRILYVRNVGNREAKYTLETKAPFEVFPPNGVVPMNEAIQIQVEYKPMNVGEYEEDLQLHYDTGETVFIRLYGVAENVTVRLDKSSVRVENTYVGLASQRTVCLHNRSDVMAHFRWTRFATNLEEDLEREMVMKLLQTEHSEETKRFYDKLNDDPSIKDKLSIVSRKFLNKKKMLENNALLFEDDVVSIDPYDGEIWPHSTRDVIITFKPMEAREYQRMAFCDVTGRETRLPLKITGVGIGPNLQFSFTKLDLGFIFVNSEHSYELVLANKGDIDAMYKIQGSGSIFSRCFIFSPDDGLISPGGYQAIHIAFQSTALGDFCEEFRFQLDGSPEAMTISIRGTVVGPTFHFDIPKLKFGTVSYGFPSSKKVTLHNTSLVAMTYELRVPTDGTAKPILATVEDSAADDNDNDVNSRRHDNAPPQEFHLQPNRGTIQPMSSAQVEVTLSPNNIGKYNVLLVVDVVGVGQDILNLPISARCTIPRITLRENTLQANRCFLNHSYECTVGLVNDTLLPARYRLLPQNHSAPNSPLQYGTSQPTGIIQPSSTLDVPIEFAVSERAENEAVINILIFGSERATLSAKLICYGEGPVIHVTPSKLEWGQIPVLQDVAKIVELANESLIPAAFHAHLQRSDAVFRVEPSSGLISPQQSFQVQIIANLNDCLQFQDVVEFDIKDSVCKQVQLTATGQGSTVIIDPPMPNILDLGPHFSKTPLKKQFKLINRGRRHQQLVWSTDGYSFTKASRQNTAANSKIKAIIVAPTFHVTPHRFDLSPGESAIVTIHADVDIPRFVKERILCHAIIGRQGGKELIKRVDVQVDFIAPLVEFSSTTINFRIDKKPNEMLDLITQKLHMKNLNGLNLNMHLTVKYPFQILLSDSTEVSECNILLHENESHVLDIQFDPAYKDDFISRFIEEHLKITYAEHPHEDIVLLKGEVHFPNVRFESQDVNFGCIVNHTEATKYISMINDSPLPVRYRWSFLVGDMPNIIFHRRGVLHMLTSSNQQQQQQQENNFDEKENFLPFNEPHSEEEQWEMEQNEKEYGKRKSSEFVPNLQLGGAVGDEPTPSTTVGMNQSKKQSREKQHPHHHQQSSSTTGGSRTMRNRGAALLEEQRHRMNPHLRALLEQDEQVIALGIEEVFDITPLYGQINSGESETITMTFFGHADIEAQVTAACEVEGGPLYLVNIHGEASVVHYSLDTNVIDYGCIHYDQVAHGEIILRNTGKVAFYFEAKGNQVAAYQTNQRPRPQQATLDPISGYVPAFSHQIIHIRYWPSMPTQFQCEFPLQIAHFEPEIITLQGIGTFPRIHLDLPRVLDSCDYELLAKNIIQEKLTRGPPASAITTATIALGGVGEATTPTAIGPSGGSFSSLFAINNKQALMDPIIQMEVERKVVENFALIKQKERQQVEEREYQSQRLTLDESEEMMATSSLLKTLVDSQEKQKKKIGTGKPAKVSLPEYLLDFGNVILGEIRSIIVRATNTGQFPVSFKADRSGLADAGFIVELDKVRNLPGAPTYETLNINIRFDPRGANLPLGQVDAVLKLTITNGPIVPIRLCARVTMSDLTVNQDVVQFGEVKCSEAKVITVQLHNPSPVSCEWNSLTATQMEAAEMLTRRSLNSSNNNNLGSSRQQPNNSLIWKKSKKKNKAALMEEMAKPPVFEIMPAFGSMQPNERVNVQIKFMPLEEKVYEHRLSLRLSQSSNRLMIRCRGKGMEPKLDFDQNLLQFGPTLPFSLGDEKLITVHNPCPFPIEFYNLEFDQQYLDEERILRLISGYDLHDILILPPRNVGEKLPDELLEHYEEQIKKVAAAENERLLKNEVDESATGAGAGGATTGIGGVNNTKSQMEMLTTQEKRRSIFDSELGLGDSDDTPAKKAIARYLKLDLSAEGKAAIFRRGMAIIVQGAPLTGKTNLATMLATQYSAALLTIDSVIIEALANPITPSAVRARELCTEATRRRQEALAGAAEAAALAAEADEAAAAAGHETTGTVSSPTGRKHQQQLTVETLAAQTTSGGGKGASSLSNRKVSSISGPGKAGQQQTSHTLQQPGGGGGGAGGSMKVASHADSGNPLTSSPTPGSGPQPQLLGLSDGLMSTVLPDDIITDILNERLLLSDCHRGVVFDGLDTLFSHDAATIALCLLRALNNRRHIYCVSTVMSLTSYLDRQRIAGIAKEQEAIALKELEQERLENMTEEEYDALPEEERQRIDELRLGIKRERIRRKMEEDLEREREDAERREAELRRLEEEKNPKKKGRRAPPPVEDKSKGGKGGSQAAQGTSVAGGGPKDGRMTRESSMTKTHTTIGKEEPPRPDSHATEKSEGKSQDEDKRRKSKIGLALKSSDGAKDQADMTPLQEEAPKDPLKEADRLLHQKFKNYEMEQGRLFELFKNWDRSHICERRPTTPSDKSEVPGGGILDESAGGGGGSSVPIASALGNAGGATGGKKGAGGANAPGDKATKGAGGKKGAGKSEHDKENVKDKEKASTSVPTTNDSVAGAGAVGGGAAGGGGQDSNVTGAGEVAVIDKSLRTFVISTHPIYPTNTTNNNNDDSATISTSQPIPILMSVPNLIVDCNLRGIPPGLTSDISIQTQNKLAAMVAASLGPDINNSSAAFSLNALADDVTSTVLHNTHNFLPTVDDVLDGLGLGKQGPIVPPEVLFSVVTYPPSRKSPADMLGTNVAAHYQFVSPDMPGGFDDKREPGIPEEDENTIAAAAAAAEKIKDEPTTQKGRGRKAAGGQQQDSIAPPTTGKDSNASKTRRTSGRNKQGRRGSGVSSPATAATPTEEGHKLGNFRWIVPPNGEVQLKLRFMSEQLGQFDQTMNFEIVGSKRRYQLYCRGICAFPTISKEPRIVFPSRKKEKKADEIVHKKYILNTEKFEFGPLHCDKLHSDIRAGKYLENVEKLTICNTSPMVSEVSFCFLSKTNPEAFSMEPNYMKLGPGESQKLTLWAHPKTKERIEDAIICCVRENPEPIIFQVVCDGERPELQIDLKTISFDKVLLHRKETKEFHFRNSSLLPLAWKILGLEALGDDFSMEQDAGLIEPKSEITLNLHFRAMKPYKSNQKRTIRVEVRDVSGIVGMLQTENIEIKAEAYDVALDMSFPKGADGGIDFGILRVGEESKQIMTLRNKGPYEIQYSFEFEKIPGSSIPTGNLFTIQPNRGVLTASDKAVQLQITYKANNEFNIREQPILFCQVIEPSLGEKQENGLPKGEMIASIPIKISAKSVYSKFTITPAADINFGAIIIQNRKIRNFTIENNGEFDFKFNIVKIVREKESVKDTNNKKSTGNKEPGKRAKSRDGSSSGRSVAINKRPEPQRADAPLIGGSQGRLQAGLFTISPAAGLVPPKHTVTITVDCMGENPGICDEELIIDISDRNMRKLPNGIPYRLFANACVPSINVNDFTSIFEEHRICKNLNHYNFNHEVESGGIYSEEENRFLFPNVLVGQRASARFRITNSQRVPCDVVASIRAASSTSGQLTSTTRTSAKSSNEIFEVQPNRTQIAPHSYVYITVWFTPLLMQQYSAIFEANIDGLTGSQFRGRPLTFEIIGEGNLPRINVLKPAQRNKHGEAVCLFHKLLCQQRELLPLIISNTGNLPCQIDLDLIDPHNVFTILPSENNKAKILYYDGEENGVRHPHTASVAMEIGQQVHFNVLFSPKQAHSCLGQVKISLLNNQYEDTIVQLIGDSFDDDLTFDNLQMTNNLIEINEEIDETITSAKHNLLQFGWKSLNEAHISSFNLTNHSKVHVIRFQWPMDITQLKFSPSVGHIAPGKSKRIVVTFKSLQALQWKEKVIACRIQKIIFNDVNTPADWDDLKTTIKWIDIDDNKRESNQPRKKRIVETEPEPSHSEVALTAKSLELLVSVVANYSRYSCPADKIVFRDTLMFQERKYSFPIMNDGEVPLEFHWQILLESPSLNQVPSTPRDARPSSAIANRRPSSAAATARNQTGGGGQVNYLDEEEEEEEFSNIPCPFTIEPSQGVIPPGAGNPLGNMQQFTVTFSPLAVADFEARCICHIKNLDPQGDKDNAAGPVLSLRGRSLQPFCHFEVENSDYLSGSRRNPELRGPGNSPPGTSLDPQTRVIELKACGIGRITKKMFPVINPTKYSYNFMWVRDEVVDVKEPNAFQCLLKEGKLKAGRKLEMGFQFNSSSTGIVESFWKFILPDQSISVPFLVLGDTREPQLTFDRSHFNYRSLLVGHEACEIVHIINLEDEPFEFHFDPQSLLAPAMCNILRLDVMEGFVLPKERMPIKVYFTPKDERELNFNVICNVRHKSKPLTLNVKAEGYSMRSALWLSDEQEHKHEIPAAKTQSTSFDQHNRKSQKGDANSNSGNGAGDGGGFTLNLQSIEIGECITRRFDVMNEGKFDFTFDWKFEFSSRCVHTKVLIDSLKISPRKGTIKHSERIECLLTFRPMTRCILNHCSLLLTIANGATYVIDLVGEAVIPGLHLAVQKYDFGPCFLYRPGLEPAKYDLIIENVDKKPLSVDCLYESTAQLQHNYKASIIEPGQKATATFTFMPRESIFYNEEVEFEVNGMSKSKVVFAGQGTDIQVDVIQPKDKILRLGSVKCGTTVKKTLTLVNQSLAKLSFHLSFTPSCAALKDKGIIKFHPSLKKTTFTLPPKAAAQQQIEVTFSPNIRIAPFTEEIFLETNSLTLPVFAISGSCHGYEIHFDMEALAFGPVTEGSQLTKRLVMINAGDIGTKFKWRKDALQPDFSITPLSGYITPGMEVTFDVIFKPTKVAADVRYENILCDIDGWRPLPFTLTGICTEAVAVKETQNFLSPVRQRDVRTVQIKNSTNATWILKPLIEGDYWSGAETLVVEPQQIRPYEIVYVPLTMTTDKKHQGSIFFALPDGSAIKYNLVGTAEAPKSSNKITRDIPCKTNYIETLSVTNWLKRPQRFKVLRELVKPEKQDPGTQVKGLDYLDVPGDTTKEYKLSYYTLREGQQHMKITFINETTGEYLFYELIFRAGRPSQVGSINLRTPVRQATSHTIQLDNPLGSVVTFQVSCTLADLQYPAQIQIPEKSEGPATVDFFPLKIGEQHGRIEFICPELGLYAYEIHAVATLPAPERALYFKAHLGMSETHTARFTNHVKARCDYTCRIEPLGGGAFLAGATGGGGAAASSTAAGAAVPPAGNTTTTTAGATGGGTLAPKRGAGAASQAGLSTGGQSGATGTDGSNTGHGGLGNSGFHVDKNVTAAPGAEISVDVTFEPTQLGEERANLIVSNPQGGEFIFPLYATALMPKPQGPFTIKAGSSTNIPFRNVFTQPVTFTFQVDNSAFHLTKTNEAVRARKDHRIVVGFDKADGAGPIMGKLLVTCPISAGSGQGNLQWIFYLRGLPHG